MMAEASVASERKATAKRRRGCTATSRQSLGQISARFPLPQAASWLRLPPKAPGGCFPRLERRASGKGGAKAKPSVLGLFSPFAHTPDLWPSNPSFSSHHHLSTQPVSCLELTIYRDHVPSLLLLEDS